MAFDALGYRMRYPFPMTLAGDLDKTYTTTNVIKAYTPGQYCQTWDPLYGFRIFKLMKNLSNASIAKGNCLSYVNPATVGTITAGSTTSITSSSMTANDLEYQMINVTDDIGGAGAAPEGETSLCISNTSTLINLHPDYPFSTAIAASDTCYVIYQNGFELAASGDLRGPGKFTNCVCGIAYGAAADNEWCWVCQKGFVTAAIDASGLPVAGDIKVDATSGYVAAAAVDAGQEIIIGQAATTQNAATASSATFALIYIDVFTCLHLQTTP